MVDLFGRTGQLDMAMGIINQMPAPVGPTFGGALLGACKIHQNPRVREVAARNLFQSGSEDAGYYILLSNIYAVDGNLDYVAKLTTLMDRKGLKEIFGTIEVRNKVHSNTAGENSTPS